ncbi:MAG: class I SAM-dependent methyltransferase [Paracoccaceae bacterium]
MEGAGLRIGDIECLRLHYALTLRRWFDRFNAKADVAAALKDERFGDILVQCLAQVRGLDLSHILQTRAGQQLLLGLLALLQPVPEKADRFCPHIHPRLRGNDASGQRQWGA